MRAASFISSIALLTAAVSAATNGVFVPQITAPVAEAIWKIGSTQTVTWDISNAPADVSNPEGEIFLRNLVKGQILFSSPLATGFSILAGNQSVTVPNIVPGSYQIVLVGDSGNFSPIFRISN
ncbi:hypothetical protein DFP72DRAFT_1162515 [Ephemerocybe angulata]|uniref:Uncharacterized protein n=1 Tax=Ephemerocybe angulata TaxID=980116 RepID=A0A8H6M086_9AGAR|nr:hypothetical protein DFP72DRAFT_972908 [Tulosesus angulatus]KAF6765730.1 hypothetical protein DFP72DRAFT_1162515 [Tulosesus angulatus]